MPDGNLLFWYTWFLFGLGFLAGYSFRAMWGRQLRKEWRELNRRRRAGG